MIPGLTPIDGHQAIAEAVIAAGLIVHLYAAQHAPAPSDTPASYRELELLGYNAAPLSSSLDAWRLERHATAGHAHATAGHVIATYRDEVLWRFGLYGPTVFGYYVTLGARLYAVQPFAKAFAIENRGDVIAITPAFRFGPGGN